MDSYYPTQGGGIRYLMNALSAFLERGWQVIVVGIGKKEEKANVSPGWTQIQIAYDTAGWIKYLLNLFTRLPFIQIPANAVIITHRMDCMLAFVLYKPKNPKVFISTGPAQYLRISYPLLYRLLGFLYHFAERMCLKGVDYIIPVDLKTKEYYQERYPQIELTDVIPSAIDLDNLKPIDRVIARSRINWHVSNPIVIFVGRLSKVKNIPLIIKAFKRVEKIMPEAEMYLIGNGEDRESLLEYASRQSKRIHFVGIVPPNEINLYYSAANVTVLCSLEEGSPTVIKEALACGIPVISTDVGDVAEILTPNPDLGEIVSSEEELVANAILKYLLSPQWPLSIREKRRDAVLQFGTKQIGSKIYSVAELAAGKRFQREKSKNRLNINIRNSHLL